MALLGPSVTPTLKEELPTVAGVRAMVFGTKKFEVGVPVPKRVALLVCVSLHKVGRSKGGSSAATRGSVRPFSTKLKMSPMLTPGTPAKGRSKGSRLSGKGPPPLT